MLSIFFALGTLTMFFHWAMVLLPLAAIYFGRKALHQIERMPEEYAGRAMAKTGIWLAAGLGIIFTVFWIFWRSEVPHGYQEIDYSQLEPNPNHKGEIVPPEAQKLSDNKTRVYIKGYMLPPQRGRSAGLTKFSICRTSDMCKFGMNIARPCDEIHVELTGDPINYSSYQIGIGGVFKVDSDRGPQPYYLIEADYIYH